MDVDVHGSGGRIGGSIPKWSIASPEFHREFVVDGSGGTKLPLILIIINQDRLLKIDYSGGTKPNLRWNLDGGRYWPEVTGLSSGFFNLHLDF